jgi:hypothetical protein
MSGEIDVIGSFATEEMCVHAIEELKDARIKPTRVFAPIPSEHINHALGYGRSPVRALVLAGGITGILTGFAVTIGTSMEWWLNAGGKPMVSLPPFIIIAFELMILFGGTSAVLGFLLNARMPQLDPLPGYSERFSSDRFGVLVRCAESEKDRVEGILKEAGAETVAHQAA